MSCHNAASGNFCPKHKSLGESIKTNCINCHMPEKPSDAISYQLQQSNIKAPYLLRTHKIAVYTDSLQKLPGEKKEIHNE